MFRRKPDRIAFFAPPIWQRIFVVAASLVVLTYALAVLIHGLNSPDIGLASTFRLAVSRIDPSRLSNDSAFDPKQSVGHTVTHVAGESIMSWPQWIRIVHDLDQLDYPDLPEVDPWPGNLGKDAGGQRWVKVELSDGAKASSIWLRVGRISPNQLLPSILWIVLELGLFLVGVVVFWSRPNDTAARLFFLMSLVVIGAYMGGYHWTRICTQPFLTAVYIVCGVLLPAINLHFFVKFPTARPVMRLYPKRTLAAIYALPLLFMVAILGGYGVVRWLSRSGGSPEQINLALSALRDVIFVYFGIAGIWYVASVVALIHGYRSARDIVEKNQSRWLLIGSLLALVPIGYSLFLANQHPAELSAASTMWPMFAASTCFTLAFAIGITRYRLLRLDQMMNSSLAYVLVSGLAALIYCALVVTGMLLFGARGPSLEQAAWVGGSALVLSISLDAARTRLAKHLDRRYRRNKTQLDLILQRFGEAVEQLVDTPTLARRLLQVTTELYGFPRGGVYLRSADGGFDLVASLAVDQAPTRIVSESPLLAAIQARPVVERLSLTPLNAARQEMAKSRSDVAVALIHEGQLIGLMVLGRALGQGAATDDARLLASFAPVAALALVGADVRQRVESLNRELQVKVEKISEQQRRILSLQQQLINQSRRLPAGKPSENGATAPAEKSLSGIVGSSAALQQLLDLVPKVAANNSAVLVRGESGTGKELVAQALHDLSPRSGGPFVKVHCAALAPGVLESELFGHVKGAFTGALRDKPGRFESAHEGTLFLDEIGDISLELQTKLLRVIQEKTFERVGSNEPIRVDVRLITATHQDLERLIREGRFRSDLYYRLNVITLTVPPLRDREEDIIELIQHFVQIHSARCRKAVEGVDDDALMALRYYSWPGNIRELENVIERAVVVADGSSISLAELPEEFRRPRPTVNGQPIRAATASLTGGAVALARSARHARERAEIVDALIACQWNRTEAAKRLGLARSTLLSRMKKYQIASNQAVG